MTIWVEDMESLDISFDRDFKKGKNSKICLSFLHGTLSTSSFRIVSCVFGWKRISSYGIIFGVMVSNGKTCSSKANGQNAEFWSLTPDSRMMWVEGERELEGKMFVLEDMFLKPAFMDLIRRSTEPRRLSGVMGVHDRVEPWTGYLGSSVSFSMDWTGDETETEYGNPNPWKEGMWTFSEVEVLRSVIEKEMMERGMKSPEIPMVIWGRGQFEVWFAPGEATSEEYQTERRRTMIRNMKGRRI